MGAWVSERAEGVARLARAAYLSLGIGVASVLFLTLDPPSEWGRPPASTILAFLATAISLPLGALRVFQHVRAKWFQTQLLKFRTGPEE